MSTRLILGIESSCDETSAAVVRRTEDSTGEHFEVLSNVVASQLIHASYGGVVPELASREHLRAITPVTREAMHRAHARYEDLDAVAVTEGPGLAGALLVGITFAKSLAFGISKPLIAVNHLEGHIHAVLMQAAETLTAADPLLALVVSGGHTHLYLATRSHNTWRYRNVGKTLDDAAGEAFDKVAKLLGLPYPGGPWIDALAAYGDPSAVPFTFAQIKSKATGNTAPKLAREAVPSLDEDPTRFDLSFSGIKTAVRRYVELHNMKAAIQGREQALQSANLAHTKPADNAALTQILTLFDTEALNLIASFQSSVTHSLTRTTFAAAEHFGAHALIVSGGVAANSQLRARMTAQAAQRNLPIAFPTLALSTDNAAMIAAAAFPKLLAGQFAPDTLEPTPQLRLG